MDLSLGVIDLGLEVRVCFRCLVIDCGSFGSWYYFLVKNGKGHTLGLGKKIESENGRKKKSKGK